MEGDGTGALNKRPSTQFKKKGANKKGKRSGFRQEHREVPNPSDTVYRILCPSRKIGGVIGKGGGIIKALREDTKANISVSDLIPGSDERVIMVYSPPDKILKEEPAEGNMEDVEDPMLPHCPAQDALMRVHNRILEEDLSGGSKGDEDEFTARLLVPHNMVGCLLGKGGDVIQRLRSETGANIRVLSAEHLPTCALSTDEIVQIQGNPMVLKKALYEASTLLHQNPRKEKALNFAMPFRGSGFHPAGPPVNNMPLHRNPMSMWSPRNPSPHIPPPPWMDDHASYPGFVPGGFVDGPNRPGVEGSGEFSMKILCLDSKIGGIIGKGGTNVRQLQQETGTSIHVEDAPASSEERVIRVSAFETLRNTRSQTIDAILLLQNKASEVSDKGVITTRLLVPSNKVGCLLGQGGTIINEMRRRTQADIRVYAKDEKQECALEDEELVQVSGSFAVARDALGEIASRLRARCLSDASTAAEPPPHKPVQGHGPGGSFPRGAPPVPGPVQVSTPAGYSAVKGDLHDYEPPSYPVHPSASGYPVPNSSAEVHPPNSAISPIPGAGAIYSNTPAAPGTVDVRGGTDYYNAAPTSITHDFGGQNNPQQGSYSYPNGQGSYPSMAPQQAPHQGTYQNPHQVPYQPNSAQPSQVPYQPNSAQPSQVPYQPNSAQPSQQSAYESVPAHGAYQY